ncbi:MAG TPA: hypothetical protein VFM46_15025 [Pseudomonadales bacterium]|nr:hypothetical protein [Pseudomonadales bacterium]
MKRSFCYLLGVILMTPHIAQAESAQVCLMRVEDAAEDVSRCGSNCDQLNAVLEERKQACRDSGFTEDAIADAVTTGRGRLRPAVSATKSPPPVYKPKAPMRATIAPARSFKEQNARNFAKLLPGVKASSLHYNYGSGSCKDAYLGDGSRFVYVGHKRIAGSAKDPGGESVRLFVVKMEQGECYPTQAEKKSRYGGSVVYNLPLSLLDMWMRGEGLKRTPFSAVRVGDLRVTYCSSVTKCSHMMR